MESIIEEIKGVINKGKGLPHERSHFHDTHSSNLVKGPHMAPARVLHPTAIIASAIDGKHFQGPQSDGSRSPCLTPLCLTVPAPIPIKPQN